MRTGHYDQESAETRDRRLEPQCLQILGSSGSIYKCYIFDKRIFKIFENVIKRLQKLVKQVVEVKIESIIKCNNIK